MSMTVFDCLAVLQKEGLVLSESIDNSVGVRAVAGLSFDNRTLRSDEVFVCKGAAFRQEYLAKAIEAGALIYVSEFVWNTSFPYIQVYDIRLAMATLAKAYYENDVASLKKIGITGTKGKSTVSALLNSILDDYYEEKYGVKTALISSIKVYDGLVEEDAKLTTPEALDLWRHLANAGKNQLGFVVCEVSSQALKYHRTRGINFDAAVFLNIGEDHISDVEHPDFEDYFSSKLSIFKSCKVAFVNSSSDQYGRILSAAQQSACEVITFGFQPSDTMCCVKTEAGKPGTRFLAKWNNREEQWYEIALCGRYNIENALAALAVVFYFGIPYANAKKGLSSAVVKGRGIHLATDDKKITAIVDYAHNKMSMQALFSYTAEAFPHQKVISVFGAPGQKAKNRRLDMASVASEFSDYIIVTEDDPAGEPLENICKEIAEGIIKSGTPYEILYPREEAIQKAFSLLEDSGGVILLCGKGAETSQKRKNGNEAYEGDEFFAQKMIEIYNKNKMTIGV